MIWIIWDIYARFGKKDGQLFETYFFTNSSSSKAIPNLQSNSERPLKPQKVPEKPKKPEKPEKSEKPEKPEKKIQVNYKTKAFGQLMSDVVFTISGTYYLRVDVF